MKVYLDNAATAPIKREVRAALLPYLGAKFGNPSSIHSWGQAARQAVDKAREQVARFLNCSSDEIIFTSGGTEADNLAISGMIISRDMSIQNRRSIVPASQSPPTRSVSSLNHATRPARVSSLDISQHFEKLPHIITTQIEHHAVLKTCEDLAKTGQAEVTYIKPNREGIINPQDIEKAFKKNTVLVSIMYVNNEIGTIQPIREIGKMIEKLNRERSSVNSQRIYFHTDAVQAAEFLPMDVDFLHVDFLTISGHKIGAPKGIGALYARKGTSLKKIIFGGEQELNLRSGTENVAGIVALGKAVEIIGRQKTEDGRRIQKLRDYFTNRVLKEISGVELNGSKEFRIPNNANFYFKYIEGESILLNLDLVGIAASSGSACTSLSLQPSHVLMACFNEAERAHGSVRFTLGEGTSKEEIDYTIKNLKTIVRRLRAMSPLTERKR